MIGTQLRSHRKQILGASVALALIALTLLAPLPDVGAAPQERHITISASTFSFEPATLRVNRGDTLLIDFESTDVVHGLYVDGYGVRTQAEPGRPGELRFVAEREGAFHFRCSIACGNLHPFMTGEMIVEPNLTWLRAVVASLIATIGTLIVLWRR